MDLVRFERERFERIRTSWSELSAKFPGACFHLLPISALEGDNVVTRSHRMPWYRGPSLLGLLETLDATESDAGLPLRFAVQYVIRPNPDFRGYAGRIDSGAVCVGDHVTVLPSGKRSRVKRIVTFDGDLDEAFAPMPVTLVLEDELDISRGDWICAPDRRPHVSHGVEATLVWMHERPLQAGADVLLQQGTTLVNARINEIVHRIDPETMAAKPASQLALNEIGLVRLEAARPLVFDRYRDNRRTGSFILIDRIENSTLAAGMADRTVEAKPRSGDAAGLQTVDTAALQELVRAAVRELERRGTRPVVPAEEN
jgi:sulfate adenylyltransferase subunit 1 (EFTu-like GTPase family)